VNRGIGLVVVGRGDGVGLEKKWMGLWNFFDFFSGVYKVDF
jgi:hypothetical protein